MPACADTSVNSIGPEGRGGVGLATGEGVWFATSAEGAVTGVADSLHAATRSNETSSEQNMTRRCRISLKFLQGVYENLVTPLRRSVMFIEQTSRHNFSSQLTCAAHVSCEEKYQGLNYSYKHLAPLEPDGVSSP